MPDETVLELEVHEEKRDERRLRRGDEQAPRRSEPQVDIGDRDGCAREDHQAGQTATYVP